MSDKKLQHTTNGTTVDYYNADVVTANDYYPFGMQMPGRKYSQPNTTYRYGFNGKENDNEVKGEGNQIDYDKRIYDPRLGRFYSIDPLQTKFPFYSPYQFAGNTPIQAIDLDGAEEYHYTMTMNTQGKAVLNPAGPVKYSNHHSWFWGLYEFDTKIDVKRYKVDYDGKSYYIGYPQYGKGYANAWKREEFENNYIKKQGDAIAFEYDYVDENHSQAGSDAAVVVTSQNFGAETAIPMGEEDVPVQATNKAAKAANNGNEAVLKANSANQTHANATTTPLDWSRINKQGQTAPDHVNLHGTNNTQKDLHGIFNGDPVTMTNNAWNNKGNIQPVRQYNGNDMYVIPFSNAGNEGGSKGSGATLSNITIITKGGTNTIVTSYPSK